MSEVKKCPKCGGDAEKGFLDLVHWWPGESLFQIGHGKRVWAYRCKNCGYAEVYVEK